MQIWLKTVEICIPLKPIQLVLLQATDIQRGKAALWGLNELVMAL